MTYIKYAKHKRYISWMVLSKICVGKFRFVHKSHTTMRSYIISVFHSPKTKTYMYIIITRTQMFGNNFGYTSTYDKTDDPPRRNTHNIRTLTHMHRQTT